MKSLKLALLLLITSTVYAASESFLVNEIARAGEDAGVSPDFLCKVARMESGMNPTVTHKGSTARGLFGITRATELLIRDRYDIKGKILDPYTNALLAAYNTRESIRYMARRKVKDITYNKLYLAHFFGPGMALKFLRIPDDTVAKTVFKTEYGANKSLFRDRTVGELKAIFKKRFDNTKGCS